MVTATMPTRIPRDTGVGCVVTSCIGGPMAVTPQKRARKPRLRTRKSVSGPRALRPGRSRPTLAELLAQCKPENRPDPIDFGPPVDKELI
jgi:hypothetical protein